MTSEQLWYRIIQDAKAARDRAEAASDLPRPDMTMEEVKEWHCTRAVRFFGSISEASRQTGMARKTIGKYVIK